MKKLLLTAAAVLATLSMHAATTSNVVTFSTVGATDPNKQIWVNTTGRTGDGTRAATSAYQVALYWGQLGAPADTFAQVGASAALQGTSAPGTFFGGGRTIVNPNGAANGDTLSFQVKGWGYIAGVPNTYEAVKNIQNGWIGESAVFTVDTKDPFNALETTPSILDATRSTFNGFAITPVPEPSVIGLGLLGVGALLMLRRRK